MGKEVTTYLCCEVAIDRKIVPFERIPDHTGGNYSASLCGVHLSPSVCARPSFVSRGVSLVNFFDVGGVHHNELEPKRPCRLPRDRPSKNSMRGCSPCCARAASGHAAAPPSSVMNSRRPS